MVEFLSAEERRLASEVQGRTYANLLGLVGRFIAPAIAEGQELLRRVERLAAERMPEGYAFLAEPGELAERLAGAKLDHGVDALIALVRAVEGILQRQAGADASYFVSTTRRFSEEQKKHIHAAFLSAYRWQS